MKCRLYFPDEIKATGCEVLKHLNNLPELKDLPDEGSVQAGDWSDEQKLATIEKVCRELSDPAHPVSIATTKMQDIPEVKYPAAMAGQDRANFLRGNSEVLTRGVIRIIEGVDQR
jgi:hypothetical protein